ncbi:hypothetical protein GCM10023260_08540 [Bartonella acomydis]|uniref:Uncharacterized protein n=1 Tax=Bartonella acomydis TaxID=686234 RepID=A0ABP9MLV7_9HYPH
MLYGTVKNPYLIMWGVEKLEKRIFFFLKKIREFLSRKLQREALFKLGIGKKAQKSRLQKIV